MSLIFLSLKANVNQHPTKVDIICTLISSNTDMTVEEINKLMVDQAYYADKSVAISVFLAIQLQKPLLIEGPAGVGKTEIAKVLAKGLAIDLIRLQCYEGLDAHHAIYEWDYQRQLLQLKLMEGEKNSSQLEEEIFSEKFLMERPLLQLSLIHI